MHRAGRSFCTKQGYEIYQNNFGLLFSIPLRGVTFALHFLTLIIFVMPKMKTHSSAKKRFKVTGTGKVKRNRARMRHLMRKKNDESQTPPARCSGHAQCRPRPSGAPAGDLIRLF